MEGSVRINLSVPSEVDAVISRLAEATGRSKAAVIMEAVGYSLAQWKAYLRNLDRVERAGVVADQKAEESPAPAPYSPPESRQVRRAQERERKKAATRRINDDF